MAKLIVPLGEVRGVTSDYLLCSFFQATVNNIHKRGRPQKPITTDRGIGENPNGAP